MEKKYIITISREFGSLGRPIAKKLAELLDINFYDREIVEKLRRIWDCRYLSSRIMRRAPKIVFSI